MNLVKQGDWACPFYRMALRLVPSGQLAQCNIGIDVPAFLSVVVKPININQPYSHIVHALMSTLVGSGTKGTGETGYTHPNHSSR